MKRRIIQLTHEHLDSFIDVLVEYREFCGMPARAETCRIFFTNRLLENNAKTFIALSDANEVMGFVNLYPCFSTLALEKIWILNDLAVSSKFQRLGIAGQLIEEAMAFAQGTGAARIELKTQIDNTGAQKLYSHLGFTVDKDHVYYRVPTR